MKHTFIIIALLCCSLVNAQQIPLPENLPQGHPRLMTVDADKPRIQKQVETEAWAKEVLDGILERIDPYVEKTQAEPDWLYSRLMMYWKSHATQVYIRGGVYSHADGEAPVPTVRFGSTRGVYSAIKRPKIEDIIPYMDDTKGVFFHNTAKEGHPLEWSEQSAVSGGSIESVNTEIMRLAKDGAFVYWLTGDEKYAKFAFDVFDTYLMGMYYRTEPIDLNNGHAQTLVAMSTFEVIQEGILNELAYTYDFLYNYIKKREPEMLVGRTDLPAQDGLRGAYEATLKKWIDLTIKNGVPQNNWNLHQAKFILKIAMVLEDNTTYADRKGREYYIDYILNRTSARQWSLTKFMEYGYDYNTGIWNECPGYATGVTKDLTNFIRDYDHTFHQNLLSYTPVMKKAVTVLPQYLFPNGTITAFGDTYYGLLNTEAMTDMIRLAQKYGNREDEIEFTKLYRLFEPGIGVLSETYNRSSLPESDRKTEAGPQERSGRLPAQVSSFFTTKPLELDAQITAGKPEDYITQTFYAPNVSWFVQRNRSQGSQHSSSHAQKGMDAQNDLMISQYASYGNHAHANGIAMELYGKGYILGPESGIGSTYFEKPYLEYYSQFPAHNTVMVDGISKYPEMLSNHPFDLLSYYPQPEQKDGYFQNITYSEVYFLEPESRSDQNRLLSIIRTGETTGYYVDIFRSKKQRGDEKFHDYYYHNLGQELFLRDTQGALLPLEPSDEMAFAGGHLFALDYMWDKKSVKTNNDYQAVWKMAMPDSNHIYMHLWMKGYEGREVFSIKAPSCKAFRGNHRIPYAVEKEPFLTLAARQHGEAWEHPFVSIFEPATESEGRSILSITSFDQSPEISPDFVGLIVKNKSGQTDYIFSSVQDEVVNYQEMVVHATYAVISELGDDFVLFLGNGKKISANGFTIEAKEKTNAVLEYKNGTYCLTSDKEVVLTTPKNKKKAKIKTN